MRKFRQISGGRALAGAVQLVLVAPVVAAAADEPAFAQVEEVVVTARLREESLQEVPVAVSAFTGESLEQQSIVSSEGLVGRVPSLFFSQNQTFGPSKTETYIVMRGVGATAAIEPSTGVFLDGVYIPKMAFDLDFVDLERMEVLRGPQGTLFGRNTQGGALNLVTRKPGNDFRASSLIEVDSWESLRLRGSVSGPLKDDTVYAALSAQYQSTDGNFDNLTLDRKQDQGERLVYRATVGGNPSDSVDLNFTAFGTQKRGGQLGAGVPEGRGDWVVYDGDYRPMRDDLSYLALTANVDLPFAKLTSITADVQTDTDVFFDWDGGNVASGNYQNQLVSEQLTSQEFRLTSNDPAAKLDWLGGLYLFRSTFDVHRDFGLSDGTGSTFPPIFNPNNVVQESASFERKGYALFGQATYHVGDRLDLTAGMRYAQEQVDSRQFGEVTLVGLGTSDVFDVTADETFSAFLPMGSLSYRWTDTFMTYATVSKGFKAGGFQKYPASAIASGIPFDNEFSINYELGLKSQLADGRVQLNLATFLIDVEDQQLGTVRVINSVPVEQIANVGKSRNTGVELEVEVRPIPQLRFNLAASWVDAEFREYLNETSGRDRSGEQVPYVPEWSGSIGAEYSLALVSGRDLVFSGNYRYVGDYLQGNGSAPFDPFFEIDAMGLLDTQIRLESDQWSVALFVDNVLDDYKVTRMWQAPFQPTAFETPTAPRRIGLRATWSW